LPEIGDDDGSGGGGDRDYPFEDAEKEALNKLKQQFNVYINDEIPSNDPLYAKQIDLNPYHEIKNWTIVEGGIIRSKVTARTVIDMS
jgi:hypothetical protein